MLDCLHACWIGGSVVFSSDGLNAVLLVLV
jgi:hypothetical protein